jgi:hypothetical protein
MSVYNCSNYSSAYLLALIYNYTSFIIDLNYKYSYLNDELAAEILCKNRNIEKIRGKDIYIDFNDYPMIDFSRYDKIHGFNAAKNIIEEDQRYCGKDQIFITNYSHGVYGGYKLSEIYNLQQFNTIYFIERYYTELEKKGLTSECWYVFVCKTKDGMYNFMASNGGNIKIDGNVDCIKSIGHEIGI